MTRFYRIKTLADKRRTANSEGRQGEHADYRQQQERDWWRKQLIRKHGGRCTRCNEPVVLGPEDSPRYAVVSHLLPLSAGGTDHASNLTLVCRSCERRKTEEDTAPTDP